MLGMYNIPRISQIQIMFRARLLNENTIKAGPESQEVGLFHWDEIPWDELAFPTVTWTLNYFRETRALDHFPPATNPEGEGTRR